jgi:hypothetical protein
MASHPVCYLSFTQPIVHARYLCMASLDKAFRRHSRVQVASVPVNQTNNTTPPMPPTHCLPRPRSAQTVARPEPVLPCETIVRPSRVLNAECTPPWITSKIEVTTLFEPAQSLMRPSVTERPARRAAFTRYPMYSSTRSTICYPVMSSGLVKTKRLSPWRAVCG